MLLWRLRPDYLKFKASMGNLVSPLFKLIKVEIWLGRPLSGEALTGMCQALRSPHHITVTGNCLFHPLGETGINLGGTENKVSRKKSEMRIPT